MGNVCHDERSVMKSMAVALLRSIGDLKERSVENVPPVMIKREMIEIICKDIQVAIFFVKCTHVS
jgi:hypothetical protein